MLQKRQYYIYKQLAKFRHRYRHLGNGQTDKVYNDNEDDEKVSLSLFCIDVVNVLTFPLPSLSLYLRTAIHYQTQSYDPISCYGNSMERTNETAYCT